MSDNTYGYSSHDLDFDNKDERILEASKSYILRHIDSLSETLDEDAHVLIFLVGPGRQINDSSSSMYLWDNDELTDETFADWVKLLSDKDMCVNVFCGQNYNSGFFDKLSDVGCVVTAPRSLPQSINSAAFLLYDRFVYNWVSAICSKTADTDNNGFVSMYEAYQYMQNLTSDASQDIQYSSSPIYLGYDLAMNNIPPAVDLFMRDDKYDVGVEPYITQRYSSTPDLWMKNGIPDNNSPTYYDHEWIDEDCLISFVIANIINRGRKAYDGISDCKSVSFYWSDSRCQNTKDDYLGHIQVNNIPTGEPIGSVSIMKRIEPGESVLYEYPWPFQFTNVIRYLNESGFYPFRILGLISDNSTNTALSEEDNTNKYENKRMVDRLTYIVSTNKSYLQLYLRNDAQEIENSDVVLYCETTNSKYPDLTLNLENKLVSQWEGQGYLENMVQEATDKRIFKTKRLPISEEQCFKIGNIEFEPEEISPISLTFDFDETSATGEKYIYSLTQTDSNGKIMSGAEIVVTAPTRAQLQSQIVVTENEDGTYLLSADDTKDVSSIRWQNADGEVVGREQTLNVNPRENGNVTMILINSEGELSQDSVVLDLLTGIKSTETSADMLNVEFKAPIGVNGATLQLSPATSSTSQQVAVSVAAGAESADIDISNLQSGIYVLTMTEEGSVVDTRKLQIR
ncbi:MAG: hypothetical protein J1E29_07845 [Duncaniella sp.]|nr:hypothetical protein [Duncaniella sp.]